MMLLFAVACDETDLNKKIKQPKRILAAAAAGSNGAEPIFDRNEKNQKNEKNFFFLFLFFPLCKSLVGSFFLLLDHKIRAQMENAVVVVVACGLTIK